MDSTISRDFVISFRLNGEEVAKLDKVREGTDRTRNDYSRSIIQDHLNLEVSEPVKPVRLPPRKMPTYDRQQLSQILGQLGKIGSNINQIARHSNVTRTPAQTGHLDKIQADLFSIKKDVCNALYQRGEA